jgi:murein DD-endopeptidase MepM/ murein hydrolase activator NlpD
MPFKEFLKVKLDNLHLGAKALAKSSSVLAIAFGVAVVSLGLAEAAARTDALSKVRLGLPHALTVIAPPAPLVLRQRLVWEGADLDGDGQPDVANPTGHAPRTEDAYGEGRFHAPRDGGAREHEGVDYTAVAGQTVEAPISGFVSRIGYAYPDDSTLRYVEIDNPALHISARAFYVDPSVEVGQTVAIGAPIGRAHTLQQKYPDGITDHVHLEIADKRGRKLDAERLIVAREETAPVSAD